MISFKRNKETGIVEAWENGEKIGEITTMGDEIIGKGENNVGNKEQHPASNGRNEQKEGEGSRDNRRQG